jgi:light-independent protochlorophyllide reductase subunit B
MFRDDQEFHVDAGPSHLGQTAVVAAHAAAPSAPQPIGWAQDAETELKKIPFFVRGKARRNTELFANTQGIPLITVETLYDAKAHYGR